MRLKFRKDIQAESINMSCQQIVFILSAQTAIIKGHRPGGLNSRNLLLTVLEVGKSKIKVPANLVPW